jgi:hypothetical protein
MLSATLTGVLVGVVKDITPAEPTDTNIATATN